MRSTPSGLVRVMLVAACLAGAPVAGCAAGGEQADPPVGTTHATSAQARSTNTPPRDTSTGAAPVVPGWQVIAEGQGAFDVPPDWDVEQRVGDEGKARAQPRYRPGYCPPRPELSLATVARTISPLPEADEAVTQMIQDLVKHNFEGKNPRITWGPFGRAGEADAWRDAMITAEVVGPCDARESVFVARALELTDGSGCYVLLAAGDLGVPDAATAEDLAKIVGSLRRI